MPVVDFDCFFETDGKSSRAPGHFPESRSVLQLPIIPVFLFLLIKCVTQRVTGTNIDAIGPLKTQPRISSPKKILCLHGKQILHKPTLTTCTVLYSLTRTAQPAVSGPCPIQSVPSAPYSVRSGRSDRFALQGTKNNWLNPLQKKTARHLSGPLSLLSDHCPESALLTSSQMLLRQCETGAQPQPQNTAFLRPIQQVDARTAQPHFCKERVEKASVYLQLPMICSAAPTKAPLVSVPSKQCASANHSKPRIADARCCGRELRRCTIAVAARQAKLSTC